MKNSVSDPSFVYESEDDDEEKVHGSIIEEGSDSDNSSNYSNDNYYEHRPYPSSLNPAWPQSYRQSIDMYSSVPSPSAIAYLGAQSLSRLGSSFLASSLKHAPDLGIHKPLVQAAEEDKSKFDGKSSQYLITPSLSRKPSSRRTVHDKRSSIVSSIVQELPVSRQSSFGNAVLNGMNVLCGVGILSTPYAVRESGWLGLSILLIFALLSFYTGMLLRYCLDSKPGLGTYPDIGQAAFGTPGRVAVSVILYIELYACCVEYIILETDNLSSLFPNAHLNLGVFDLNAQHLFALMTTLAILPTVWLRDLSILSYISAGGVIASIVVVGCLFWTGLINHVGFHTKTTALHMSTLPVAIGLYGFCYSGHAVLPNIYSSMGKPSQYPSVLLTSFGICTVMYAGVGVLGYLMFGESTESQFTLNLPHNLVASKIAVWTTVVNPFTKYALTMSPVAMSLEELIPIRKANSRLYPILIRTTLVVSTLLVGLTIPFFGLVMALIGSLLTMLVTLILPCACYMSILRGRISLLEIAVCIVIIGIGVMASGLGTYSALSQIVSELS